MINDRFDGKPVIAVPIGDPAGIGPEIAVKALKHPEVRDAADVIVIGDKNVLENAIRITGTDLSIQVIDDPSGRADIPDVLSLIDLPNIDHSAFQFGAVQAMCGRAAYEYIKKSIDLAMNREVDAVATTPINKEALRAAGIPYIGHTEIFGALTGTSSPLTMFETNGLRIFFLTRHQSIRDMLQNITKDNIKVCVRRCVEALKRLGITEGAMAVAGLNPHCGEHGLFGWEEVNEITPAVEELQGEGINVVGPISADSVFHLAAAGRYNSVLALYHDQGHIAAKTLDFDRTISVTNGMPILRTSVDHGTAFDIAGRGIANETSMAEAILLAAKYAPYFR